MYTNTKKKETGPRPYYSYMYTYIHTYIHLHTENHPSIHRGCHSLPLPPILPPLNPLTPQNPIHHLRRPALINPPHRPPRSPFRLSHVFRITLFVDRFAFFVDEDGGEGELVP